jgi:secondary thiamine-phosphate synthase enzyme
MIDRTVKRTYIFSHLVDADMQLTIILDFQEVMPYCTATWAKLKFSSCFCCTLRGEFMVKGTLKITTSAAMEMVNITAELEKIIHKKPISSGILYLFNPHTTAGLTINEGADPDVCRDIIMGLQHIVPNNLQYRHAEGNSPAHLMTLLTGSSLMLHINNSILQLGTWQKIFFCEYDGPRTRSVHWKIISDPTHPAS